MDTDGTGETPGQPATTAGRRARFPDIAELTYEQARDELIASSPSSRAARSASRRAWRLWQRGEALAAHCSTWLDDAEATLTAGDDD